jgi:hypothetical protein
MKAYSSVRKRINSLELLQNFLKPRAKQIHVSSHQIATQRNA